ncbi:PLDc N-terminal domain-containing protein [Rhodovulum marinum]|uniref:Phospholipase D-like protein n=1 Tax=Rhodovulum marinum TaxID=320662 RepID=A0A4R2Q8E2_9RHOB|nr:PLDc N-terminal domain-containing protein [Rhodovulum marinum]TCP43071.1 phospholipase D-like protein [Rhodovulum marinum]
MVEVMGIGGFILLVLDLWAIVSVLGSASGTGQKVLWVLLILVLPLLGFLAWLLFGPKAVAAR